MKKTNFEKVKEFQGIINSALGKHDPTTPTFPDNPNLRTLRLNLIDEERRELEEAHDNNDIVGVADALTDMLYVIYGMGICYGIDLDACFEEVHSSNMTKFVDGRPTFRPIDGKVMKGDNYRPPNLVKILFPPTLNMKD